MLTVEISGWSLDRNTVLRRLHNNNRWDNTYTFRSINIWTGCGSKSLRFSVETGLFVLGGGLAEIGEFGFIKLSRPKEFQPRLLAATEVSILLEGSSKFKLVF